MIIFILPLFSAGGAERVTLNLLSELHFNGTPVGIVVFNRIGKLLSMVPGGVPIYDLEANTLKRSIIPLIRIIHKLKPKVVFSTFGYINVALLSVRWALPRRTSIWAREANLPSISLQNNPYSRLMVFLYGLLYKNADKVICTSKIMLDEFILDFMVPVDLLEILPNPVDVKKICSSMLPVRRFDKGGVCYIAAGRLVFQKGFDRLLYWFSKLDNKNSTLVILGDGELKGDLNDKVELLNLQKKVKFVGFYDNPWPWYAGADVFLLASHWEGMPNSVLESLVCGTPVIATEESGGINEISENGSVVVVSGEREFIDAMNKASIKDKNIKIQSLLPEVYVKENVVSIFRSWLDEIK